MKSHQYAVLIKSNEWPYCHFLSHKELCIFMRLQLPLSSRLGWIR